LLRVEPVRAFDEATTGRHIVKKPAFSGFFCFLRAFLHIFLISIAIFMVIRAFT